MKVLTASVLLILLCGCTSTQTVVVPAREHDRATTTMWYRQPARSWQHDALPIGNGRLGAMIFGGVGHERIALNEDSVWSGSRVNWNRENASENLPEIRKLLLAGKNAEAEALVNKSFTCVGGGSRSGAWGCFQELGNLNVLFDAGIPSVELNNWKYLMITTPGITDIREHRNEVRRLVDKAIKVEASDSGWADYLLADGRAVKGEMRFELNDKAVLRHHIRLTDLQAAQLGTLRIDHGVKNGQVYVNGKLVGDLPGWQSIGHARFQRDVSRLLKPGDNLVAIYCSNYRRRGQMPVYVSLDASEETQNYRRSLDLRDAIARVQYTRNGVTYSREAFATAPDGVMVFRFTADKPGMISFSANMDRLAGYKTQVDGSAGLLMTGNTTARRGEEGMRFVARLRAVNKGGSVSVKDSVVKVTNADEVTLLVAAGTDYKGFAGRNTSDPERASSDDIRRAVRKSYDELRAAHIIDHRKYFDRVSLSLDDGNGDSHETAALPTNERHAALGKGQPDPALAALYFNFGRYLLINSSRPGTLPANLQGLWAEGTRTPWNCDYHIDINVQMNYWVAEVCGLGDCHTPLFKLIESLQEPGAKTARIYYKAAGWVAHVITNIWGFTAPGEQAGWGATATGSAWLCDHLWEHYDYGRDTDFLKWAYPIIKGSAEFFLDMLIEEPKEKWLVTSPSNSPENTFIYGDDKNARICMGPTMDMQILRELFGNCIEAAEILGVDEEFRKKLTETRARLAPNQIGKHGQIQEWLEDYDEREPQHRHVSHLYGLHPHDEITPDKTPELAKAAKISLQRRGDGGTGWSMAWKVNFWARLRDGNHALLMLNNLIKKGGINLFCQHPPFQIDGNFGGASGVAEMLLQSQGDVIRLLPALPDAWSKGRIEGFRARGGYQVDIDWDEGELVKAVVHNVSGDSGACTVAYRAGAIKLTVSNGGAHTLFPEDFKTH